MRWRRRKPRARPWLGLVRLIGVIVPRRLRAAWRQEWEAELRYRETLLAEWDQLNRRTKLDLLWHSAGAFADALWLQPRRMEDEMFQDLRFGIRLLRKNPGFTAVAVFSLALGIGANTAIFSLIDAVLLKLLPVKHPEQLVVLEAYNNRGESRNFSQPVFEQLRARTQVFSGIFAAEDSTVRMEMIGPESGNQAEQATAQLVSGEYFQVLGVNAVVGRTLTAADNQTPGAHPVAVLSYGFWQRRFAGDVSIVGKSITLKEQPFTIIGVTMPGFFGEAVGRAPDIWAPLMMQPSLYRGMSYLGDANLGWLRILARLRPGAREEQARVDLATVLGQIKSEAGELAVSTRNIEKIELFPGHRGLAELRNSYSKPLRVLMVVVALVLLIACANVANLLLARTTARQREVAIRLAIGARRFRLIRQFLTESVLLAAAGGMLGLLFAWWGSRLLLILVSGDADPIPIDVTPNARILGFTVAVSLLTALLFGLAPALIVTRQDVNAALKATATVRPRLSLSRPLVIAQVALSLVLLTGAGLFVRTLHNLRSLDLGFASEEVLQARINPGSSGYKRDQLPDLYRRLLERLTSAPGVRTASMASGGFLSRMSRTCCIAVEGYTHSPDEDREIRTNSVTPGYFQTIGLPLLLGRDFTPQEVRQKPGEFPIVAIINETMARYYFGKANPLGKRIGWGNPPQVNYDIEIIGVAKDANYGSLRDKTRPLIYYPSQGGNLLVARAGKSVAPLASTIRREIQAVDKSLEIDSINTVPQLHDQALVQERMLAKLSGFFSLLALLLASIGIYGLTSYDVVRRTSEIGIRMALGAQGRDVIALVMRGTLLLVGIGVILGLSVALGATHVISSLLYDLKPNDPLTIALAGLLLLTVAALAGYLPARRAARIDPMIALRHE
jgi:predicted permease